MSKTKPTTRAGAAIIDMVEDLYRGDMIDQVDFDAILRRHGGDSFAKPKSLSRDQTAA
ncbi:MAG: hypothetical protein ORN98_00105 [Alphaproteobacteria bacterium]|nr:hypothetical protein [Alphaproteobacteria bacterium]